ncbi:hypothetical protein [Leptospira interrogans]|uniref:Uncharacterized protein n=1 Tax=Leptospira interrogans serovar Canicola TaxID=211880 RepID=A0AAP9WCP5_LEPIR|nr:hypothetical protein [Leptospira interrogans]QOI43023.1 hypothetical protein Lepto782_12655 [Leptospira interrogans serovar Canicola]
MEALELTPREAGKFIYMHYGIYLPNECKIFHNRYLHLRYYLRKILDKFSEVVSAYLLGIFLYKLSKKVYTPDILLKKLFAENPGIPDRIRSDVQEIYGEPEIDERSLVFQVKYLRRIDRIRESQLYKYFRSLNT